jgi:hypothetical protein
VRDFFRRLLQRAHVCREQATKPIGSSELEMALAGSSAGRNARRFVFLKGATEIIGAIIQGSLAQ